MSLMSGSITISPLLYDTGLPSESVVISVANVATLGCIMDLDYGVDEDGKRPRKRYDFDLVRPGASTHAATDAERCRIMAAFKYWARKTKNVGAYATSAKVGDEDPKGPGFRIWFKSKRLDAERTAKECSHAAGEDI